MSPWSLGILAVALAALTLPAAAVDRPVDGGIVAVGPALATLDPIAPDLIVSGAVHPLGQSCSSSALCVRQVATAYDFTGITSAAKTNGTGETIAIVDACGDPSIRSDLKSFDAGNGLPAPKLTLYSYGPGSTCVSSRWAVETALDVEWSHAMAPGAAIDLVVATRSNNSDMFGAWGYVLANGLGNVISNSWSGKSTCPGSISATLATAESDRVSVLASTGDTGDWGVGTSTAGADPADCPSVLGVGGTTLHVNATGAYRGESAWAGSGGGYVKRPTEPKFQRTANLSDPYGDLGKPDVAAVADPATPVWIYEHGIGGWATVGGTSVACPIWAGLVADADALRAAYGFSALGDVDPYLYKTVYGPSGSAATYAADFHDVTTGSNGWSAGVGWDPATGLGSMNATALVGDLGTHRSA